MTPQTSLKSKPQHFLQRTLRHISPYQNHVTFPKFPLLPLRRLKVRAPLPHPKFPESKQNQARPFLPPPWTTTDDRLRNGASRSSLTALPQNAALFAGHLDTKTLGGAGFASQFSPYSDHGGLLGWDLTPYAGIEVELGRGDGKIYTIVLKDEAPQGDENSGAEKSSLSWEATVRAPLSPPPSLNIPPTTITTTKSTTLFFNWSAFKPTYRGKPVDPPTHFLDTSAVKRIGVMMRSFFGEQQGKFELELRAIVARVEEKGNGDREEGKMGKGEKEEEAEEGEDKWGWVRCVVI